MRPWWQLVGRDDSPDGGFSLIEMLVVIVIVAILAAMVTLAVGSITDKGKSSACGEDYRTIQTAEEAFFGKPIGGGTYTDMSGLVAANLLTQASSMYDVAPSGSSYTITAIPNNPNGCTVPT